MFRLLLIFLLISGAVNAQELPYKDLTHYSKVFGTDRTYRLYLPEDYEQSGEKYPVIYFFHGWGGRYFKDDSAKLEYERLGELVDKYRFIMVMWDGNISEKEPRPYNVGTHEDVKFSIQMKDYFPELISCIDSSYRTYTDRNHRGIIGFSMGGFMASYLAGKYPDKISAITGLVSSPEFFIGYPENHTFYPVRYAMDNLNDVSFRFHNMDNCPLFYMNTEVKNAAGWYGLNNFEYWLGKGDHSVDNPGEIKIFENAVRFVCERFKNPIPVNRSWSHYDLYPDFDLWGYSVKSNKNEPGFIYLRNVSHSGFGIYTKKWLPGGPPVKDCTVNLSTAAIYTEGNVYDITVFQHGIKKNTFKQTAGKDNRLHFELTGDCEVNISPTASSLPFAAPSSFADYTTLEYRLKSGKKFIRQGEKNELLITLLNRGSDMYVGKTIRVSVSCADSSVLLSNTVQNIKQGKKEKTVQSRPIEVIFSKAPPKDASPPWLKLNIEISCGNEVYSDYLTLPVFYKTPDFKNITIDDGFIVRDKAFGAGNKNGQVNASERVMLYENNHRLRLFTDDPYVENAYEELYDEMIPAIWPDGFTFGSVVKIADNCPSGHIIEFLACYETKTFMPINREVHWGRVRISVK